MNILNEVKTNGYVFSFLDGGIVQVSWTDNAGNVCFSHYSQIASDGLDWREGVRAPKRVLDLGGKRGCSLALDYYQSVSDPDAWFLKNPNSKMGILLTGDDGYVYLDSMPHGFVRRPQ